MISFAKYKNKKVVCDNITFDSIKESKRYLDLKMLSKHHKITQLELQPKFKITVNNQFICHYKADFSYTDCATNKRVVEDVKGFKTPVYRLKKKLTEALFNITITEL